MRKNVVFLAEILGIKKKCAILDAKRNSVHEYRAMQGSATASMNIFECIILAILI